MESKGFLPEIIIDDYPLRGKIVKLHVKRRRWTDKSSGEILQIDWQLVAKGTRMTKDLAGFLKKLADTKALPLKVIAEFFGIKGKTFQRQYKNKLSEYHSWEQKRHAEDWIIYPENLSSSLSLDEVALSDGELYTVLTSKTARGRKGSIVAIIKGTQSDFVITHLLKISRKLRMKVNEITLDMAGSMKRIAQRCFPGATQVIDRFHVQKLATEALQEIRIRHRWDAIEMENTVTQGLEEEKNSGTEIFENGDSRKQLLARSRYLLYKSREKWTLSQKQRAVILFAQYPDLEKAYQLTDGLRKIYNQNIPKSLAMTKLAHWFKEVEEADFKSFSTLRKTIMNHYRDILNYFHQRSTNAAAESFNAKIKSFRMQLRGVKDRTFFLFRLTKLFA
ncbi:ISAon1 family transposase [Chryseobacterium sp. SL1]